jgi:lactocepin
MVITKPGSCKHYAGKVILATTAYFDCIDKLNFDMSYIPKAIFYYPGDWSGYIYNYYYDKILFILQETENNQILDLVVSHKLDSVPISTQLTTVSLGSASMTTFSSWGISASLDIKPEITAPGFRIYSSFLNGTYKFLDGTSMATPFVAGSYALMLQQMRESHSPEEYFSRVFEKTNYELCRWYSTNFKRYGGAC